MAPLLICKLLARPLRVAVILAALASLLAGCGERETAVARGVREGILLRGNGTEPESLDPHVVRGATEFIIAGALFEGLVALDPAAVGGIGPGVAEAWETSADGLTWTFRLRDGARWSNGDPVTAEDFLYSARRLLAPGLGATHTEDTLHFVRGARAYQRGEVTDFGAVGIVASEARTIVFTLEHPAPFFLSALWQFYPVHRATIERFGRIDERGTPWTRPGNLVGNGPFLLTGWRANQEIAVDRNPHYWDAAAVRLNGIRFLPIENPATEEAAFRNGQLHLTNSVPLQKIAVYQREQPGVLQIADDLGNYFYSVNVRKPPLDRVEVRRALALAIDREALVSRVILGGKRAATAFTPAGLGGFTPRARLGFDPDAARELLAAAGFPGGQGFPALELLIDSRDHHRVVAEAVQQMWREHLGINVALRNEETRVLIASKRNFDFDLARGSWNATSYRDPHYFQGPWVTGGHYNEAGWSDPAYDAVMAAIEREADPTRRAELQQHAEDILVAQVPAIPIYWTTQVFLLHPSVRGYVNAPFADRVFKRLWLE